LNKAIFLDRDGVLNQTILKKGKPRAPYTLAEFALFDGVPEAIELLKKEDYILIVVTNQPDVARGWVEKESVEAVNRKLLDLIQVDEIMICYHTDKDDCTCRKPKPGMLINAAREWDIDLKESYMIGDRHSDIEAGKRAGCKTILIGEGDNSSPVRPDLQYRSLLEATKAILSLS
jgi:D-glycero-D-manno-heptose 1,7-bisphosphate phosphatase